MSNYIDFWDKEWMSEVSSDDDSLSIYISVDQSSSNYQTANDISSQTNSRSVSGCISEAKQLYEQLLHEEASCFMTIEQLKMKTKDLLTNVAGVTINVYGIMKEVNEFRCEETPYNPYELPDKYILLVDPSCEDGLRVRLEKPHHYFNVGDILRIRNLQLVQGLNAVEYYNENNNNIHIIKCLEFGYVDGERKSDCDCDVEQSIAHNLEKWYASKIFADCRLNKLPLPKARSPDYVNLVCQVLSKQVLQQSIVLRIHDGLVPNRAFDYKETVQHINALKPLNPNQSHLYRDKTLKLHENVTDEKLNNAAVINIWGNESGLNCNHFNAANSVKLVNGKDLLLLLNVEVTRIMDGPLTLLVLRSGRHKGKAVRVVNKDSLLGKMITEALSETASSPENPKRRKS